MQTFKYFVTIIQQTDVSENHPNYSTAMGVEENLTTLFPPAGALDLEVRADISRSVQINPSQKTILRCPQTSYSCCKQRLILLGNKNTYKL